MCMRSLLLVAGAALCTIAGAVTKPHVLFIVSDDLGYNDVSFHGSSQIPTPRLDALARSGVILSHYFVQPVCSPTRATFASGRHVIHTGVYDPMNGGAGDLSLNFSLWSNGFKKLGYSTHAIGKWHIGMSSWRFTPLERGFDSYYGYLGGGEDYWTHDDGGAIELFDGRTPVTNASCTDFPNGNANSCPVKFYSADLFTTRAIDIIQAVAEEDTPMFMYLAYQSVHSPDEAPQYLIDQFNNTISNSHRRTFAGMVAALDLSVGQVVDALTAAQMFDNTVLVFSTDNGGPADNFNSNMACNWPLRGMKRTLFEGGVRGVGFLRGPGVPVGQVSGDYVHAADWFHTLLRVGLYGPNVTVPASTSAAGVRGLLPATEPPFLPGDGMDVWDSIRGVAGAAIRSEVLHEAHPHGSTEGNGAALRVGDLKIVIKTGSSWSTGSGLGSNDGWFGGPESSDNVSGSYCLNPADTPKLSVKCGPPPADFKTAFPCELNHSAPCLFNVTADPCEHVDLSTTLPQELLTMLGKLAVYQAAAVPTSATKNPDGGSCPYITEMDGVRVWMPCENNGSRPFPPAPKPSPPPSPAPPPPANAFQIFHGGKCLSSDLSLAACASTATTRIWYTGKDGAVTDALMAERSCLKVFEASGSYQGGCDTWQKLHLGVCRDDSNSFSLRQGELVSNLCPGKCVTAAQSGQGDVVLGACAGTGATDWSER